MAKAKENKSESGIETIKVEILKDYPLCGNPVGDICELPKEFAEQLIADGFAKEAN